jgi:hypothetical protein
MVLDRRFSYNLSSSKECSPKEHRCSHNTRLLESECAYNSLHLCHWLFPTNRPGARLNQGHSFRWKTWSQRIQRYHFRKSQSSVGLNLGSWTDPRPAAYQTRRELESALCPARGKVQGRVGGKVKIGQAFDWLTDESWRISKEAAKSKDGGGKEKDWGRTI